VTCVGASHFALFARAYSFHILLRFPASPIHVKQGTKKKVPFCFQVEEYFERLEVKDGKKLETKRVYIASDDPKVLSECRKKFTGKIIPLFT
jgi:Alpha-(1,6)-fucosyltransferase N- and catalytic domains